MASSVRDDEESSTQQNRKRFLVSLTLLASIIKRLANFMQLTDAEQKEAGIHIERMDGE